MVDKFEELINGIVENGFAYVDNFISIENSAKLRNELLSKLANNELKQAGIGKGENHKHELNIRGDNILWIDNFSKNPIEKFYLSLVNDFISYLNQTCYTGLNDCEIHYAYYPVGSFYKKHVDSFVNDSSRKYSIILYLNENWKDTDGGELVLYPVGKEKIIINPVSGRLVCFPSHEIPHEVLTTKKARLSITGWIRK